MTNDKCPSCEHSLMEFHSESGCWFTVITSQPDANMVCPCGVVSEAEARKAKS